jgi:type IV pilus biogenesis protein PilP
MQSRFRHIAFICSLAITPVATAESVSDRITQIEAETLVLKARERQLEVQASILTKQQDIMRRQAETDRMTNTPADDPVVRSIESIGRTAYATIELPNGLLVEAKVGDELANGMKVMAISPSEVTVERDGRRTRLTGASPLPPAFNPNYPNLDLGLIPSAAQSRSPAAPRGPTVPLPPQGAPKNRGVQK